MDNRGVRYSFSLSELRYLLFKKKNCPDCNTKLTKQKSFEIRTDMFQNSGIDPILASGSKVKQYSYAFKCDQCGYEISLSNLSKKGKK